MGWRTRRWIWMGATATLLKLASTFPVSGLLLHSLKKSYPELSVSESARAQAIVLLCCFWVEDRGADEVMNFGETSERFAAGALLWKAGRGERLCVMHDAEAPGARRLGREVERRGVEPGAGTVALVPGGNTADEARRVRSGAQKECVTSIILVTTVWQMPHAMQLFPQIGLEINPSPVDYQAGELWTQPVRIVSQRLRPCLGRSLS